MEARFTDHSNELTLFDRLGGRVFVTLITEKFCERIMIDPKLRKLFKSADACMLKKRLTEGAVRLLSDEPAIFVSFRSVGSTAPEALVCS